MTFDRIGDRHRAAIVQERSPEAQPPQRWRSDLAWLSGALLDVVASTDIVQQQVGK
jgi:hypothetical protein